MTGAPDDRPDIVLILTDQERAAPGYETEAVRRWRRDALPGHEWFARHGVAFDRHYTGSLACVPSRPTLLTGQYPDVHGVTQTDGLGKLADDSRMRWMRPGEIPTIGHWFRAAGYDTHYDGKWHVSHADLIDEATGEPLATNDDAGEVDAGAVRRYLDADRLDEFGFSGWVGPEPHGGSMANSGLRRDGLIADRACAWLEERYAARRRGDEAARLPFLVVVSFVNPHDIVLFPGWVSGGAMPIDLDGVPEIPAAPTANESLDTKPAAQRAYRDAYPTGYGPPEMIRGMYDDSAADYRRLYSRLHREVDGHLDRVRRVVSDGGDQPAVIALTADHGELLGAHGGLHQKWFSLYDEATRVPCVIARTGGDPAGGDRVTRPTSHVDVLPTLLAAAGIDVATVAGRLAPDFSEFHPLPGTDMLDPDGGGPGRDPAVYLQTRDNILEGDHGASAAARILGADDPPPPALRIHVPVDAAANLEGVVGPVRHPDGGGHVWKLVRVFDDPATWTEPGVRHLADDRVDPPRHRTEPLADEWELYDLDADPVERDNRADDPTAAGVRAELVARLDGLRATRVPRRHHPWPYAARTGHRWSTENAG